MGMTRHQQQDLIVVNVPPQRLPWLASELKQARIPYQVDQVGNQYELTTQAAAVPILERVLDSKPHSPSWLERLKRFAQEQIYFVEEMIFFIAVGAALIAGVKFFGLGQLDPSFDILFRSGADLPLIRAVLGLGLAVIVLLILNKTVGKPAGGAPRGIGMYRTLSVLLIGGLVVVLWLAWAGEL
jgi:hypothetical protein